MDEFNKSGALEKVFVEMNLKIAYLLDVVELEIRKRHFRNCRFQFPVWFFVVWFALNRSDRSDGMPCIEYPLDGCC